MATLLISLPAFRPVISNQSNKPSFFGVLRVRFFAAVWCEVDFPVES
jgi:hypothetical protein